MLFPPCCGGGGGGWKTQPTNICALLGLFFPLACFFPPRVGLGQIQPQLWSLSNRIFNPLYDDDRCRWKSNYKQYFKIQSSEKISESLYNKYVTCNRTLNSVLNMCDLNEDINFEKIKNRAYTIINDTMYNYKDVIITIIFDKYHNELTHHNIDDINNDILFKYIIFFYLCLLKN
jgi:hypothetical protein